MTDLHTLELSHGKPRLTGPRQSHIGTVPTGGDRSADHDALGRFMPGNQASVGRGARRALTAPLRAARTRLRAAVNGEPVNVADELLADALAVYGSARAELGTRSVLVLSALVAHATETTLAGWFVRRAAEVGFDTEQGMLFHDRALACEQAAARAMTAALAATKALSGRKRRQEHDVDRVRRELTTTGEAKP